MQKEFLLLEKTIKNICAADPVYYLANPGNWGDALIRQGAKVFFRHKGIQYTELKLDREMQLYGPEIKKEGTLIYGGSGAWCSVWDSQAFRILNRVKALFRKIIVLPSTYEETYTIPDADILFFCRDSYESKKNMPSALFCHDMAFYIGKILTAKGSGTGKIFRIEAESSKKIEIPPDNIDISFHGTHFSDIGPFLNHLAKYSTIHTDRLHVAIAACLMGLEVHLYPGSYFKSKAVYLSSMKDYFPNIHFHDI